MAAVSMKRLFELRDNLHPGDCPRLKRWLRTTQFERIKTVEKGLAKAEKELKPRARDWTAFLAFLKELLPLILPLFIK